MDIRGFIENWLGSQGMAFSPAMEPWLAGMREENYAPGDLLVQAGTRPGRLFILCQGLVRLYYVTPEGKERNKAFFAAGDITGAVSAAMTGEAAPFSIEALEPVSALSADFAALLEQVETEPTINTLYRALLATAFIRNEQREAMLLTCNAEQRYQWLVDNEPALLERVPQFHIATYLGVDPVSLSRIKRKLAVE